MVVIVSSVGCNCFCCWLYLFLLLVVIVSSVGLVSARNSSFWFLFLSKLCWLYTLGCWYWFRLMVWNIGFCYFCCCYCCYNWLLVLCFGLIKNKYTSSGYFFVKSDETSLLLTNHRFPRIPFTVPWAIINTKICRAYCG